MTDSTINIYEPPKLLIPSCKASILPQIDAFLGRQTELLRYEKQLYDSNTAVIVGMTGVGKTWLATKIIENFDKNKVFWHQFGEMAFNYDDASTPLQFSQKMVQFREGNDIYCTNKLLARFFAEHNFTELLDEFNNFERNQEGSAPSNERIVKYILKHSLDKNFVFCFDDYQFVDQNSEHNDLLTQLHEAAKRNVLKLIVTSQREPQIFSSVDIPRLTGLSLDDSKVLIRQFRLQLHDRFIVALRNITAGNPLFLRWGANLLEEDEDPLDLIVYLGENEAIVNRLLTRVDRVLSDGERQVMKALAVLLDYPSTQEVVQFVADCKDVKNTLSKLVARNLLDYQRVKNPIEAARKRLEVYKQHSLLQTFYYSRLDDDERRLMHHRAAQFYEAQKPPDLLKQFLHYANAEEYNKVVAITIPNSQQLLNMGHGGLLHKVINYLPIENLEPVRYAELSFIKGDIHARAGDRSHALKIYEDTLIKLSTLETSLPVNELKARTYLRLANLEVFDQPERGMDRIETGLAIMTPEN